MAFDSDVMVNPKVRGALDALTAFLTKRGAHVQHVTLPPAPDGGKVGLDLLRGDKETIVRVTDTGPGISEKEREAVLRRFYRSDKMRNTPGVGLGLSLVAAIIKLHGFRLVIQPGPGGRIEIVCPDKSNGPNLPQR